MNIVRLEETTYDEYCALVKKWYRKEDFCLIGKCTVCGKDFKKKYCQEHTFSLCSTCATKAGIIKKNGSFENGMKKRQEKYKKTCLEKYGVDCAFKSKDVSEKIKSTFSKKYGDGITNPSQVKEIRDKVKATFLEKYGNEEYLGTKDCLDKTKQTSIEKYGTESPNSSELVKKHKEESCLEKYGVTNPNKLSSIQEKISKTCLEKYGRRWNVYKYYYDDKRFDSSWELKLYLYLKDKNINFVFHPVEYITEYFIDGVKHVYEPDFLIEDKLYEIKGSHFFDKNGELIDVYNDKHFLFEKQQCMEKLGVIILTENSNLLKKAFEYFKSLNLEIDSFKRKNGTDNNFTANN